MNYAIAFSYDSLEVTHFRSGDTSSSVIFDSVDARASHEPPAAPPPTRLYQLHFATLAGNGINGHYMDEEDFSFPTLPSIDLSTIAASPKVGVNIVPTLYYTVIKILTSEAKQY